MAAFEKVCSGIPQMDEALDYIRLGDNVVWQVSSLDEFRLFAEPFARQAVSEGRNLIYVRFAGHPPILHDMEGLRIVQMKLSHRFETFTVNIHNLIEKEGKDALYVFDCLSELEEAWATDLLMGDFFHLTCPYLFSLDTIAFFPVIRGRHSFDAIAKIRDTTQLFLDVYSDAASGQKGNLYVRPMKVWNRYSETMFSPHRYDPESGEFRVLSEGVEISRFYARMNQAAKETANQNIDSWERFFLRTRLMYDSGLDVTKECSRICDIMLTRDERLRPLIKKNFSPSDYFEIHSRMIGTGMIGGKACGMLLARKIIENRDPVLYQKIEPHDSFYIGSDVFYSYIVDNGFWDLKIRQRTDDGYFALAEAFAEEIMKGSFSLQIEAQFVKLIEYYGNEPIIVRSSSILEDGFGNAFAGMHLRENTNPFSVAAAAPPKAVCRSSNRQSKPSMPVQQACLLSIIANEEGLRRWTNRWEFSSNESPVPVTAHFSCLRQQESGIPRARTGWDCCIRNPACCGLLQGSALLRWIDAPVPTPAWSLSTSRRK